MEVRSGCVAGGADETDLAAGLEGGAGHDGGIEHGQVAVRPDLAVEGAQGQADAATGVRRAPGAENDRVGERVERRSEGCGDVDGRVVVMRVRGRNDACSAADGKDVAAGVRRCREHLRGAC